MTQEMEAKKSSNSVVVLNQETSTLSRIEA